MGVLKSRHGAGTFVSSGPPALDSSSLSVLGVLHGFLPWQMFEARLVIESNVAALAAERCDRRHIAELAEKKVAEMLTRSPDPHRCPFTTFASTAPLHGHRETPILGALMETYGEPIRIPPLKTVVMPSI